MSPTSKCTKRLTWFCLSALFPDKHRPRNPWHHQSQHAVTVALLFRHCPTQDLHADGQRLLPPVPPLSSLQGSSVPSQTDHQGTPAGEEGVNSLTSNGALSEVTLRVEKAEESVEMMVLHHEAACWLQTQSSPWGTVVDGRRPSWKTDWKESKIVEALLPYMCECRWGLESWVKLKCNKVTITQDCRKDGTFLCHSGKLLWLWCVLYLCESLTLFVNRHASPSMTFVFIFIYLTVIYWLYFCNTDEKNVQFNLWYLYHCYFFTDTTNCLENVWKWGVNLWK